MKAWPFRRDKTKRESGSRPKRWLWAIARWVVIVIVAWWVVCSLTLVAYRFVNPPTTAVQVERRVQSWFGSKPYHERHENVPLSRISPNLQHAVIAAEDATFYHNDGFDWQAMRTAAQDDMKGDRLRGGSTLTQQLVKNLFLGTERDVPRKIAEASLVPVATLVLGKQRILDLYLNEVEWGRGVYGAQAACRYYYGVPARDVSRDEAARLAAILPAPRKWRPQGMGWYSGVIERRMSQMGW